MKKFILSIFTVLLIFTASLSFSGVSYGASPKAGIITTDGGNLNIRASASTKGTVLLSLKNKTYLSIAGESGNWYKIEYANGKYGYAHKDYITPNLKAYRAFVTTKSGTLNVRAGGSTSYKIKDTITNGTKVTVVATNSTFSKIIYKGRTIGYVASAYLQKEGSAAYKNIKLSVTSFKQTDSRWSNLTIGTQGDTLGKSGCTTTALAMTESFRTGTSVTPAQMRNKLSYSASGLLYWPSNYNTELVTSSNYLSKIYELLNSGKPVILGAKGSSQHWVVITGHTANTNSLSAANFTINDPGSNTRTTLPSFLSAYPNVYKIAYYK